MNDIPKDVMIRIDGKAFRCDCGCNVFRKSPNQQLVYVCNSCNVHWYSDNGDKQEAVRAD